MTGNNTRLAEIRRYMDENPGGLGRSHAEYLLRIAEAAQSVVDHFTHTGGGTLIQDLRDSLERGSE